MKKQTREAETGLRHLEILAQIQTLIRERGLTVGDRLPSERALASDFQASRNSVREAIRSLIEKGLLTSRRGGGTFLASEVSNFMLAEMSASLDRQRRRLKEIYQFRKLLEPEIAALAVSMIGAEEIERLKLLVFEQERCLAAGLDDSEYDRAFHLGLAKATGNRIISEVMHILEGVVGEGRALEERNQKRRRASVTAHIQIIDALQSGDRSRARQAMLDHLAEVEALAVSEGSVRRERQGGPSVVAGDGKVRKC